MAEGQVIREVGLGADMAGHEDARIRMGKEAASGRGSCSKRALATKAIDEKHQIVGRGTFAG